MEHGFTATIIRILENDFGNRASLVFAASPMLQYLNEKTRSASRGSKSRPSFGTLYAIYVLVDDYLAKGFHKSGDYSQYAGAQFSQLLAKAKKLPFGSKMQNHYLNNRVNHEFRKFFPTNEFRPIMHEPTTRRYWINTNLLKVKIGRATINIAPAVIQVIDAYVEAKRNAFEGFIETCRKMQGIQRAKPGRVEAFISDLLKPNVDARVFEIVSFAILKQYYAKQSLFWGWTVDELTEDRLILYKTGRTNANDGGIDFVMRPLGRFFQVTETTDVRKYLLDIDKVQRYPITFVVKSTTAVGLLRSKIQEHAERFYSIRKIVERYMQCVEEIINIPILLERFHSVIADGQLGPVIDEIVLQSKVEFNYEET